MKDWYTIYKNEVQVAKRFPKTPNACIHHLQLPINSLPQTDPKFSKPTLSQPN